MLVPGDGHVRVVKSTIAFYSCPSLDICSGALFGENQRWRQTSSRVFGKERTSRRAPVTSSRVTFTEKVIWKTWHGSAWSDIKVPQLLIDWIPSMVDDAESFSASRGTEVVVFVVGMCLGIQFLVSLSSSPSKEETYGDTVHYWKNDLRVPFISYSKAVVYKLVILPGTKERKLCDKSAFALQEVGGLPVKNASLFQTLGNTNVHVVSGHVDDRIPGHPFIRLVAIGLYPGPGEEIYCNYNCSDSPERICSVPAYSVVILAGNSDDYVPDANRKSLMDVLAISCPLARTDSPTHMTLTHQSCGFSHNHLPLSAMTFQGVMAPMWDLGVCVRPLNIQRYPRDTSTRHLALWIEYLRLIGVDGIHLYTGAFPKDFQKMLKSFSSETFRIVFTKIWDVVESRTEEIVSEEAAINDCLYSKMMKYKTVVVMSFNQWPSFGAKVHNFKDIVRDPFLSKQLDEIGGLRISASDDSQAGLIVRPKLILNTAANHFIPLTGRYEFRQMSLDEVRFKHYSQRQKCYPFVVAEEQLEKLVTKKLESEISTATP